MWGTEYPDLLLTESTAFHDVRVKNTAEDTSGDQFPDDGPDQYRIPQGSLFLEFYCTRNRQNNLRFGEIFAPDPSFPAELYDVSTLYDEDGSLNLEELHLVGCRCGKSRSAQSLLIRLIVHLS